MALNDKYATDFVQWW